MLDKLCSPPELDKLDKLCTPLGPGRLGMLCTPLGPGRLGMLCKSRPDREGLATTSTDCCTPTVLKEAPEANLVPANGFLCVNTKLF
jgi:hypothetical protein